MVNRKTRPASNYDSRAAVDPRIPVYLLTGLASNAKSALINYFAQRRRGKLAFALSLMHRCLWRIALAGATDLSRSPDIARLRSGDLCIDAGPDPAHALCQLHLRRLGLLAPSLAYDAIILDVGNSHSAASVAAVMQSDPRLDVTYRIAGIIHAVAVHDGRIKNNPSEVEAIGEADTIVLVHGSNKETGAIGVTTDAVRSLNPLTSVISIDQFDVEDLQSWNLAPGNYSKYEGLRMCHEDGLVALSGDNLAVVSVASNVHNDRSSNAASSDPLRALRIHMQGDVDMMEIMCAVQELCAVYGRDALRLSAALNVRHADYPVAIEVIGGTLLQPAYHSDKPRTDSDICILGRGLDVPRTLAAFSRCIWGAIPERKECRAAI